MAFTQTTLATVGANSSAPQSVYSYKTSDPIATVIASGYFNSKQHQFEVGDILLVQASDGFYAVEVLTSGRGTDVTVSIPLVTFSGTSVDNNVPMFDGTRGKLQGSNIYGDDAGNTYIGDYPGGDYTQIEDDGTVVFKGDATVWEDLRVPAQNTKLNPTKSEPAFESLIDGLFAFKFDTSNADDESIHFVAQMPHSYKAGSDIYPHLHWCPDNTDTGNVFWSFEYTIADIGDTFGSTTTSEITVAADGTALKHQIDDFATIDGTGLTISHILICRLTRRSTSQAADTFTGNACFLEFDFHFEIDTLGSRAEKSK